MIVTFFCGCAVTLIMIEDATYVKIPHPDVGEAMAEPARCGWNREYDPRHAELIVLPERSPSVYSEDDVHRYSHTVAT